MWRCGKCQHTGDFIILESPRGFAQCSKCNALFFIKQDGSLAYCQEGGGNDNTTKNLATVLEPIISQTQVGCPKPE